MRKQFILMLLTAFSCVTYAQVDSYDISTYKVPDVWWHQLTGNFDLDQSYSLSNIDYDGDNIYYNTDYEQNQKQFEGMLDLEYEFYKNTKKYQGELTVNTNGLLSNYQSEKDDGIEYPDGNPNNYKQSVINGGLNANSENRYFIQPKIFAVGAISLNTAMLKSTYDFDNDIYNNTGKFRGVNSELRLGAGYGRIERVEDARQAVLILKKLQKVGKLTREPSEAEITEFAELISELKNILYFDSRNQKIDELQAVNEWFLKKGLIEQEDGEYFAHLNDMWEYGRQQIRRSGFSIEGGLHMNIFHELTKTDYEENTYNNENIEDNLQVIGPYVSVSYNKPISLTLQHGAYIAASYSHNLNDDGFVYYTKNYLGAAYRFGFYPNTRTDINTTLGLNYGEYSFPEYEEDDKLRESTDAHILISGNYYISPQLRLNGSFQFVRRFDDEIGYRKTTNINQSLYAKLTYYIF